MPTQRLGEAEFHGGKLDGQLIAGFGQIVDDVNAWREEIRQENDRRGASLHAQFPAPCDIRLGEFEIRHLDVKEDTSPDDFLSDVNEIGICIGTT